MKFPGVTSGTAQHLQLDAGAFFKNYDIASDTYSTAVAANKLIGATAGGGSFAAVPAIRRIEVDGLKGATKGYESLDEWQVTMTANIKEITVDSLALALATASTQAVKSPSTVTANNYTKITAANEIADSNYIDNITWVGRLSGSQLPVIIVIKNALCTNGLTLTVADKSEGVIPATLTGHYDQSTLDVPPFDIYYPDIPTT